MLDFIEDITSPIDSLGIEKSDLNLKCRSRSSLTTLQWQMKSWILRDRGILISLDDFGTGFLRFRDCVSLTLT